MQDDDDKQQKEPTTTRLDEANLVGNVERVVVGRQADVRLLLSVRSVIIKYFYIRIRTSYMKMGWIGRGKRTHRMSVLTLAAWTSHSFLTASLI